MLAKHNCGEIRPEIEDNPGEKMAATSYNIQIRGEGDEKTK